MIIVDKKDGNLECSGQIPEAFLANLFVLAGRLCDGFRYEIDPVSLSLHRVRDGGLVELDDASRGDVAIKLGLRLA